MNESQDLQDLREAVIKDLDEGYSQSSLATRLSRGGMAHADAVAFVHLVEQERRNRNGNRGVWVVALGLVMVGVGIAASGWSYVTAAATTGGEFLFFWGVIVVGLILAVAGAQKSPRK